MGEITLKVHFSLIIHFYLISHARWTLFKPRWEVKSYVLKSEDKAVI